MSNDPKLVELAQLAARIYRGKVAYIVLVAPLDGSPLQSMGNVPEYLQVSILRSFLASFEAGTANPQDLIVVPHGAGGAAARVLAALKRLPQDWRERVLWELVEGSEADVIANMRDDKSGIPALESAGELWQALHAYFDEHPAAAQVIEASEG